MALATRCPNCQALFRVVADQLKLRGGLVRCGACRHVFDAIGSLAYVDDTSNVATAVPAEQKPQRVAGSMAALLTPSPAPSGATAPPAGAPASAADAPASPSPPRAGGSLDDFAPAPRIGAPAAPEAREDQARENADANAGSDTAPERGEESRDAAADERMFGDAPRHGTDVGGALLGDAPPPPPERQRPRRRRPEPKDAESAEDNPLAVPTLLATHADATVDLNAMRAEHAAADEEPAQEDGEEEARRRRRRERRARRAAEMEAQAAPQADDAGDHEGPEFLREDRQRGFSVVFGGGSVVLALLLIVQAGVIFRTELVTRWPSMRPTIVQLCAVAGCTVSWPTRAELLAVVGTELQAIPGTDVLELRTVIRNRASFKVALPAIEVALTDTQNRTIARKVFAPVDYLSSSGEPAARIDEGLGAGSDYEVRIAFEARGLNAVGFVVYPFYL